MTVRELMSSPAATCAQDTALPAVARLMRDHDCGCIPVLDDHGYVVGIVTDRDICVALAARGGSADLGCAGEAMTAAVHTCLPGDGVADALQVMRRFHVRRVPVVDGSGRLQGIVSFDDLARAAGRNGAPAPAEVASAMADICRPRSREPDAVA
ncbi:MAG: CBS domain-containing protein [Vicinamibacterales bacterium]